MSAKISGRDFAASIARKAGRGTDDVTLFLRELQSVVEQGLTEEGQVKISGLGTFRLVWNEPRRSVNVQTGEAMEIAGHYKVSFTPDASLRDLVNEPLAHLEMVELSDNAPEELSDEAGGDDYELPIQKLADQAEALKDILSDIQGGSLSSESDGNCVAEEVTGYDKAEAGNGKEESILIGTEENNAEGDDMLCDGQHINTVKGEEVAEAADGNTLRTEDVPEAAEDAPTDSAVPAEDDGLYSAGEMLERAAPVRRHHTFNFVLAGLVALVVIFAVVGVSLFFSIENNIDNQEQFLYEDKKVARSGDDHSFYMQDTIAILEGIDGRGMQDNEAAADVEADMDSSVQSGQMTAGEQLVAEHELESKAVTVAKVPSSAHIAMFDRERRYSEFSDTVEITRGSRLAWVAYKQFGDKVFWPYIYEANMDHISDPNNVPVGTLLRIPVLPPELIDTANPECLRYARELHRHYAQ